MGDVIHFRRSPVLRKFGRDALMRVSGDAAISGASGTFYCVQGPIESGKSIGCLAVLMSFMSMIPRCVDGVRRSKWLVVRNSYPDLESGTLESVKQWLKEDLYGPIKGAGPYRQRVQFEDVDALIEYRSFKNDASELLRSLRSTEYTGVWVNEGQFMPLTLVSQMLDRTGRYPSKTQCPDFIRRPFGIMDMNAPEVPEHWVLRMRGDTPLPLEMPDDERMKFAKPPGWNFYVQPPALKEVRNANGKVERYEIHARAENLEFAGDYLARTAGKNRSEILRDLCNKVVRVRRGTPRYPGFDPDFHVSEDALEPIDGVGPIVGYDPGLNGALTIWQRKLNRWFGIAEICAEGRGADELAVALKAWLSDNMPWWRDAGFTGWGDPFGTRSMGTTARQENTAFDIMRSHGFFFRAPASKDKPSLRHEAGKKLMKERDHNSGGPRLLISKPGCPRLVMALDGGMVMKQVKRDGEMRLTEELVKDGHGLADVGESAEYAWWGGGEAKELVELPDVANASKPVNSMGRKSVYLSRRRKAS